MVGIPDIESGGEWHSPSGEEKEEAQQMVSSSCWEAQQEEEEEKEERQAQATLSRSSSASPSLTSMSRVGPLQRYRSSPFVLVVILNISVSLHCQSDK